MQTVFNGTKGLNNVSDPAHLSAGEGQTPYLTSCLNISVGDTGRVNRLAGSVQVFPDAGTGVHSLTEYNNSLVFCRNKSLWMLSLSGEIKKLADLPTDKPVYYAKIFTGNTEKLFWVTPETGGIITGDNNRYWKPSFDYQGQRTTRKFVETPHGHICEHALGCVWVAVGNDIYKSEPNNLYLFNLFSGRFSFENHITFFAGLEDGLWVGTRESIYWIDSDGLAFKRKQVSSYGGPEGKPVKVDVSGLAIQLPVAGTGYIALTDQGFCLLGPGGYFYNLTEKAVTFKNMPPWTAYTTQKDEQYVYTYADNGMGLTLNIRNLAVTQQACYPFNSFIKVSGIIYGANESGIFKISRTPTDASLSFWVNTGRMSRLRFLHLHGEFNGKLSISVKCDDGTIKKYTARPRKTGLRQHEYKIPINIDNRIGTYWEIGIENKNGGDFSLDRVEATLFQRRIYRGA